MTKTFLLFALLLFAPALTMAQDEVGHSVVDYKAGHETGTIAFAGTHAGKSFDGVFSEWYAAIAFVPGNVAASKIEVAFMMGSAETGNAMYDGALPQADWFDVKNHAQGRFVSTTMTKKNDEGLYTVTGDLTLKGVTHQITFDFTMTDPLVAPVTVKATFPIDRLAFGIGEKSDPNAEWVGETITVMLDLKAIKAE